MSVSALVITRSSVWPAVCVGQLGDVLTTAERLQQLGKMYSVHVVTLIDVYITAALTLALLLFL